MADELAEAFFGERFALEGLVDHLVEDARLEADGTFDPGFDVSPSLLDSLVGDASTLALQADGRILLGGSFSIPADTEDIKSPTLIRLLADGTLALEDSNCHRTCWPLGNVTAPHDHIHAGPPKKC